MTSTLYTVTQVWRHVRGAPLMYAVAFPETKRGGCEWSADYTRALRLPFGSAVTLARRNCGKVLEVHHTA